ILVAAPCHARVCAPGRRIAGVSGARVAVIAGDRGVDASEAGITGVGRAGIPVVAVDRHAGPAGPPGTPGSLHAGVALAGGIARAAARDRRVGAARRVVAGIGGAGIVIVAVDRIVGTAVGPALVHGAGVAVVAVERHARNAEVVGSERKAGF